MFSKVGERKIKRDSSTSASLSLAHCFHYVLGVYSALLSCYFADLKKKQEKNWRLKAQCRYSIKVRTRVKCQFPVVAKYNY